MSGGSQGSGVPLPSEREDPEQDQYVGPTTDDRRDPDGIEDGSIPRDLGVRVRGRPLDVRLDTGSRCPKCPSKPGIEDPHGEFGTMVDRRYGVRTGSGNDGGDGRRGWRCQESVRGPSIYSVQSIYSGGVCGGWISFTQRCVVED